MNDEKGLTSSVKGPVSDSGTEGQRGVTVDRVRGVIASLLEPFLAARKLRLCVSKNGYRVCDEWFTRCFIPTHVLGLQS